MGDCKFCSKPAGFLRSSHKECRQRATQGLSAIVTICRACMRGHKSSEQARADVTTLLSSHNVPADVAKPKIIEAWESSLDEALDDGILTELEEKRLLSFSESFGLTQADLDHRGAYVRLTQAAVLRDVLEGQIPDRINISGQVPFNLQKSEKLVWLFNGVDYHTEKTRREYVGGSSGVSIRVAKGVYFRTGGFRGRSVETSYMDHVATGCMGVTTKHIYFAGGNKAFRVAFPKIVSFEPYTDALGIMRDNARARPEVFQGIDGWFSYNLVTNLQHLG